MDIAAVWPEQYARPLITPVESPLTGRRLMAMTCWCGLRRYYAAAENGTADDLLAVVRQAADEHWAAHARPSFWVRRATGKLGAALTRWGNRYS